MTELPEKTYAEIKSRCEEGDELFDAGSYEEAKAKFLEALDLLPDPPYQWEAATWIYAAIGDSHFKLGNYTRCFRCFFNAVQCPGGLGNPYVHLRLGQMYFEQGNEQKAADELARAYMGGGGEMFIEDDPKYYEFLRTKLEGLPDSPAPQ